MAIVYVARHGESVWNAARRVQGQTDVPLSDTGRVQAVLLARRLAAEPLRIVFTSDLVRARDTATAVAAAQHIPPEVRVLAALRERHYGAWEGKSAAEVQQLRQEAARLADTAGTREPCAVQSAPHDSPAAIRSGEGGSSTATVSPSDNPPDGETFEETMARMLGAWQRVADALGDVDTGLVVGHGASLRALMCAMTGTPAAEQRRWQLHNAGLSRLRWENGALGVDYWDDGTHLVAPGPIRGTASRGDPRGDVPRRSPVRARPGTNPPARPMR